jgi:predicted alpha/beta-fold hydrolase
MTERLVLRFSGHPDLMSYLDGYAIVGDALATLAVPSRIVAAEDDPIIPVADLARLAPSPALEITTTPRGGHCGFVDSIRRESWIDRQVAAALAGR